ncbi:hypothetical protein PENSPDRAFT_470676 [Peniophora sp. CONT]|nr:hypothetical protein PENSPDRAFT_470676 [Peniophora sp. CONT]
MVFRHKALWCPLWNVILRTSWSSRKIVLNTFCRVGCDRLRTCRSAREGTGTRIPFEAKPAHTASLEHITCGHILFSERKSPCRIRRG